MPFCTACGKQNPDDARFCSQCGTRLVAAEAPGGESRGRPLREPRRGHATITFGAAHEKADTSDRQLSPVDAAAVDALPAGTRCSSCSAVPAPAAGSCSTPTWSTPAATPTARSSSTTSPSRGGTRSSTATGEGFTVSDVGSLNGTYVNRDRIDRVQLNDGDEVQIGKYRLVFFSGHSERLTVQPAASLAGRG